MFTINPFLNWICFWFLLLYYRDDAKKLRGKLKTITVLGLEVSNRLETRIMFILII